MPGVKIKISSKGSDDFSVSFLKNIQTHEQEVTDHRTGNYQARTCLKLIYRFAEHHEHATYVLGYKYTLQKVQTITC